jgi:hypothetical protein
LVLGAIVTVVAAGAVLALVLTSPSSSTTPSVRHLPPSTLTIPASGNRTEADQFVSFGGRSLSVESVYLSVGPSAGPALLDVCEADNVGSAQSWSRCDAGAPNLWINATAVSACVPFALGGNLNLSISVVLPANQSGASVPWSVSFNGTSCYASPPEVLSMEDGTLHPALTALIAESFAPRITSLPTGYTNLEVFVNSSVPVALAGPDAPFPGPYSENARAVWAYDGASAWPFELYYASLAPFTVSVEALVY